MVTLIIRIIGVLFLGAIAMVVVSWASMSAITAGTFSLLFGAVVSGGIYLVFGVIAGLFWPRGYISGGLSLASPIIIFTCLYVLFSGFGPRFIAIDLPILAICTFSAVLGCFIGKRLTNLYIGRTN